MQMFSSYAFSKNMFVAEIVPDGSDMRCTIIQAYCLYSAFSKMRSRMGCVCGAATIPCYVHLTPGIPAFTQNRQQGFQVSVAYAI